MGKRNKRKSKSRERVPPEEAKQEEPEETTKESVVLDEEDNVDYAASADAFADRDSGDDVPVDTSAIKGEESRKEDSEEDEEEEEVDDDADADEEEVEEEANVVSREQDSSEGESDDDDGLEEDDIAVFRKGAETESIDGEEGEEKGGDQNDDDDDDDDQSDDEGDVPSEINPRDTSVEQCSFDLRNLLAVNSHQLATAKLYESNVSKKHLLSEISSTIPLDPGHNLEIDESYLLGKATESCTQLLDALWKLPMEKTEAGAMAVLPAYDEIRIPRALPPPPPKQETKWEKFAKAKGIPLNKEKKSRKVWDETTGTWMYRHGYEKANSQSKEWPIMEVGANDDPMADPWEKLRDAKRARVDKNIENRMRNAEVAGDLTKGATNRAMKSRERSRKQGKLGGNQDRDQPLPAGVPIDLASAKRGKELTQAALIATQRSTASLGKFDKMREDEPERKKALSKLKKRKLEMPTDKKVVSSEKERGMKILKAVINGGGAEMEKARRKGALAKGETAYDYDYDDGTSAEYRKKKGRAGAGKMKKMTKKRAK